MKSKDMDISNSLLNEAEIAARRIPLEDSIVRPGKAKNWYCNHCSQYFSGEMTFMRHHCEPRRRAQELSSPLGQAAYGYYREWMKLKRFSQPSSAAFMESKYYRSFINFAQLVIDANISNPEKYMQLMVQGEILPVLWSRDSAYGLYLEWVDKLADPLDQVSESINYLFDVAEKEGVEVKDVFDHLGSSRIIPLIRSRRLTPWLLFCSQRFGKLLKTLSSEELKVFNTVVNSSFWAAKFQSNPTVIENVKIIAAEVGL
jgi:hypothetical protein